MKTRLTYFAPNVVLLCAAAVLVRAHLSWAALILVALNYLWTLRTLRTLGVEFSLKKNPLMLLGGLLYLAGAGHLHMADKAPIALAIGLSVLQSYIGFVLMTSSRFAVEHDSKI